MQSHMQSTHANKLPQSCRAAYVTARRCHISAMSWIKSREGFLNFTKPLWSHRPATLDGKRGKHDCRKHQQLSKWDCNQLNPCQQGLTSHGSDGVNSTGYAPESAEQRPTRGYGTTLMRPTWGYGTTLMRPTWGDGATLMRPTWGDGATLMRPTWGDGATLMRRSQRSVTAEKNRQCPIFSAAGCWTILVHRKTRPQP